MASIADIFYLFRGDDKQLTVDAAKAGDKAGKTLGERLGVSSKAGFATLAAGAGGLALIIAKGGHDVANAMADYRQQTGATQEEAAAAQKTMIELYKTNSDGFDTLGRVLAVVHNDMGLVGEDQKRVTQLVLDFAHATGIDAVAAAKSLDDVSDAYNLTLDQQRDLLDKLVVSHEKYGGSIDANLQTLIALGPALTAANLSYDDGIGLLNLFEKAGVDADSAVKGLQKALGKVKSPAELQALITDIAKTEDPLARAQKAADLFGTKAGVQLGAALAGSTGDLKEFTPAVADAAGATAAAADVIENKFTNRLKILFHQLTGDAEGLVSGIEPVIATLAYLPKALTTVSAALGLLILRNKAATVAELAHAVATKVQAAAYLLLHPQYLLTAVQLGVLTVAEIAHSVAAGLAAAATTALGVAMNLLLSPIGLIVLAVGALFIAWNTNFLGIRDIVGGVIGFLVEHLGFLAKPIQAVMDLLGAVLGFIGNVVTGIHDFLFGAEKAVDESTPRIRRKGRGFRDAAAAELGPPPVAGDWAKEMDDVVTTVTGAATKLANAVPNAFADEHVPERVAQATRAAMSPIAEQILRMGPIARARMADVMLQAAAGIRDTRSAIDSAVDQLREDMKNRLTPKHETIIRIGQLVSKLLVKGLNSGDPQAKHQAEGTRSLIEDALVRSIQAGGTPGEKIMNKLEKDLNSKDPKVRHQAERTKGIIDAALKGQTGPQTPAPGDKIGQDLASDLKGAGPIVGQVAYNLGVIIARSIRAGVHGSGVPNTGGAGANAHHGGAQEYSTGTNYVPYDMLAYLHQGEIVIPPDQSERIRSGLASVGSDGDGGAAPPITFIVPAPSNRNAMLEALETARRYRDFGLFDRPAKSTTGA